MIDRLASCFHDEWRTRYIEHEVATLVGQRVFGIALGYEDVNDHDELRHDPMMAILAGKLGARREDCKKEPLDEIFDDLSNREVEPPAQAETPWSDMAFGATKERELRDVTAVDIRAMAREAWI